MRLGRAFLEGRLRIFVIWIIRVLLAVTIIVSAYSGRKLVFAMACLGLLVTFLPKLFETMFGWDFPVEAEVLSLLFIYGLLIFWSVRGVYAKFFWWDILMGFAGGVILGLVGATIIGFFNNEELLDANYLLVSVLSFCFSFSLAGIWELVEFAVDRLLGTGLQGGLFDTMVDMGVEGIGILAVSVFSYFRMRSGRGPIPSFFIFDFLKRNLSIFKSKKYLEYSSKRIKNLIAAGEGDRLEFKSSLRKNLHTGKFDKKIEHAVLKTIAAYLNSSGGTLIVGVDNSGNIVGLEHDEFENNDKLKLYLTSILRRYLGNQFLAYIRFELYPVEDKHILKIDCLPSRKRVFLKWDGNEEFYVRYGPSTVRLSGNDLIDYVSERFGSG